jgi:hypothetical protein
MVVCKNIDVELFLHLVLVIFCLNLIMYIGGSFALLKMTVKLEILDLYINLSEYSTLPKISAPIPKQSYKPQKY